MEKEKNIDEKNINTGTKEDERFVVSAGRKSVSNQNTDDKRNNSDDKKNISENRYDEGISEIVSESLAKAEEQIKRRFEQLSEVQTRVLFGVIIALLSSFFVVSGGIIFTAFTAFVSFLASVEIYNLLEMKGERPYKNIGIAVSCAIPFFAFFFPPQALFALLTFSLISIFFLQVSTKEYKGAIDKILMTFFGIMYTGWLGGAHAILLRNIGREVGHSGFASIETGLFVTLFVIITTVSADIGAYFFGRKFGKIKIAEKISPGKTLEGFLGGILLSLISALIMKIAFSPQGSIILYAGLGVLSASVGLLGDIAESSLKRDVHVKDSGFIIPGHGGVLDRIDSILFSIPVFYYLMLYLIPKLMKVA
jgi:phosphatidate cytidylyltransferase